MPRYQRVLSPWLPANSWLLRRTSLRQLFGRTTMPTDEQLVRWSARSPRRWTLSTGNTRTSLSPRLLMLLLRLPKLLKHWFNQPVPRLSKLSLPLQPLRLMRISLSLSILSLLPCPTTSSSHTPLTRLSMSISLESEPRTLRPSLLLLLIAQVSPTFQLCTPVSRFKFSTLLRLSILAVSPRQSPLSLLSTRIVPSL